MSKEITKLVATIVIDYSEKSQRALQNLKWDMKNVQDSSSKVTDQINKLNQRLADMAKNNKAATAFGKVSTKLANISVNAKTAQKQLKAVNKQIKGSGSFGSSTTKVPSSKKLPIGDKKQLSLVASLTKKVARFRVVLGLLSFAFNALMTPVRMVVGASAALLKATTAVAAGITALTIRTTSLTKATYDTARATGVSTSFLKAWRTVVVDAGVASESAMDTLEEFRTSLGDALQDPKGDIGQAFREAGTSAEELQDILNNQGTEVAFEKLVSGLQRIGKEGNEIAAQQIADRLLKGEGAKILTSLVKRKEAYKELIKTRKQLNLLTEDQESKSVEFANLWYQVSASISSGFEQIAGSTAEKIMPSIKSFVEYIKTHTHAISYELTTLGYALSGLLKYSLAVAIKLSSTFVDIAKSFLGVDKEATIDETMKKAYDWALLLNKTLGLLVPIAKTLNYLLLPITGTMEALNKEEELDKIAAYRQKMLGKGKTKEKDLSSSFYDYMSKESKDLLIQDAYRKDREQKAKTEAKNTMDFVGNNARLATSVIHNYIVNGVAERLPERVAIEMREAGHDIRKAVPSVGE